MADHFDSDGQMQMSFDAGAAQLSTSDANLFAPLFAFFNSGHFQVSFRRQGSTQTRTYSIAESPYAVMPAGKQFAACVTNLLARLGHR